MIRISSLNIQKSANAVSRAIGNYWDDISGKKVKNIVIPQRSQLDAMVRAVGDEINAVREAGFARAYEKELLKNPNLTATEKIRLRRDTRNFFLLPSDVKKELGDLQRKQRQLGLDFDQSLADANRDLDVAKSQRSSALGYTGASLAGAGIITALAINGSQKEGDTPIRKQANVSISSQTMQKCALNRQKMHELAKSVGLIDHPDSQWKWTLRQLRTKNPLDTQKGSLLRHGEELMAAKKKISPVPADHVEKLIDASKNVGHKNEVLVTNKGTVSVGGRSSVNSIPGEIGISHSHTGLDNPLDLPKYWMAEDTMNALPHGIEKAMRMKQLKEFTNKYDRVLVAEPSGINYNRLSQNEAKGLQKRLGQAGYDTKDTDLLRDKKNKYMNEINSLVDKNISPWDKELSFVDAETGLTSKGFFGKNKAKANALIKDFEDVSLDIKGRNDLLQKNINEANTRFGVSGRNMPGGDLSSMRKNPSETFTIVGPEVTGFHKLREKLPKGVRSVYFEGGLNG